MDTRIARRLGLRLLQSCGVLLLTSALLVIVVRLVDQHLWGGAALWIGGALYAYTSVLMVAHAFRPAAVMESLLFSTVDSELTVEQSLLMPVFLHFSSFVLLASGVHATFGASQFLGVSAPSLADWVAYGLDNLCGVVLLGAGDAYGIRLSSIEHLRSLWMSTFVFSYQVVLSVALVGFIVHAVQFLHQFHVEVDDIGDGRA